MHSGFGSSKVAKITLEVKYAICTIDFKLNGSNWLIFSRVLANGKHFHSDDAKFEPYVQFKIDGPNCIFNFLK